MNENDIYSLPSPAYNACVGCTSLKCAVCECSTGYSSEQKELQALRVPAPRKNEKSKECKQQENPISSNKDGYGAIPIPEKVFGKHDKTEVYIADGNGMNGAGIYDGDYIIFDVGLPPRNGDIVIADIEGNKLCRRYFLEGEKARFRREDGITQDVVTEDYTVLGVMVGLMRNVKC